MTTEITTIETKKSLITNKKEAKELLAQLEDLKGFKKFVIEELEIDHFVKNTTKNTTEGGEASEKQLQNQKKELQQIKTISEKIVQKWNIQAKEIRPLGPWTATRTQGDKVVDLSYTELTEKLHHLKKEKEYKETKNKETQGDDGIINRWGNDG